MRSLFLHMLETRINNFMSRVASVKNHPLISIDRVLGEFFPESRGWDNYVVVGENGVEPYCLFGPDALMQLRLGVYQNGQDTYLLVERGWEEITRIFRTKEEALEAFDLVGALFMNTYLNGSQLGNFERNLRQVIKLYYQGVPALLAVYADINSDSDFEYAVLHIQQELLEMKYEKSRKARESIIKAIINKRPIEKLPEILPSVSVRTLTEKAA